jgi:hypothetical protein
MKDAMRGHGTSGRGAGGPVSLIARGCKKVKPRERLPRLILTKLCRR